ncbi:calcitonin gene-related peptide type 1 receptor [Trichonephila inaurata madagascariensis]|uniref:Calcitonin gene-related peptide type 1 receptor n=1 Tax=Trichonephila inaurata madagascariensis TaxID=2747483 RepID=A0A8X7BX61_9ARAC|nr:calcitonin gene-related peptide type 1 receptor [Trichonephila inaurata madagascariensis]
MWMFCEGFYLHKLIAASFAEQKSLRMFYFIGWVFPIFPVATFSVLRWYFADEECWAIPVNPYEWVTNSPNLLSLVKSCSCHFGTRSPVWTTLLSSALSTTIWTVCHLGRVHFSQLLHGRTAGFLGFFDILLSQWRDPGLGASLSAEDASSEDLHVVLGMAAFHEVRTSPWQDGSSRKTWSCEAFSLCEAVTDLMRRSIYRMRLRYSLDTKPTSATLSNLSDLPVTLTRANQNSQPDSYSTRHALKRDSYSIEEISDVF